MSCQICKRGACARWMHSLEEQERFDERETMSDGVDELRRTVQGLRDEIRELVTENITLRESANAPGEPRLSQ
jgi:regulator of replication initiation timing